MDKDYDGIILGIVIIAVAGLLYFGFTTLIKKGLKSTPTFDNLGSSEVIDEQKRRAEDVRRQQKELMRQQKEKMRDMQR